MATSYTSNKKIGALDTASTPLAATNELVINQNGDILKTPLSAIEAKVFDAKTATSSPTGTEVVVVRQTDDTLRQVALSDIVPALNITNAKVSASAAIADTKLATISTAGKVSNSATTATSANTINAIVARDGSGNFSAGTITATLAGSATGNAGTATTLQNARTIAISGDVTGTATSFNGSANITIPAAITAGSIVNADINASAAIADTKLATIATAGKVSNSATTATSANTINAIVARDGSGNFSAGTITASLTGNVTGNVTGNAGTATTLQTARTIAISGDVTGTATSFNGSANISISSAITAGSIVDADVNASAAIALSKLATGALPSGITVASANIVDGTIVNADINNSAAIDLSKLATGALPSGITVASANLVDGTIVNADISASAAIAGSKLADNSIDLAKLVAAVQQSLVPVGAVQAFAMNSAPSGWVTCDGAAVSRTGTYAALFAAIGITYGGGNGTTTFNVPDLRGYFVRGSGTNSDGTAAGTFGAKQADDFKAHTHPIDDTTAAYGSNTNVFSANQSRLTTQTIRTSGSTGGTETRPKNIAMLYCIKF